MSWQTPLRTAQASAAVVCTPVTPDMYSMASPMAGPFRPRARASAETQRRLWAEREAASTKILEENGVTILPVEDKQPFIDAVAPVYERFVTTDALKSLLADIQAGAQ